MNESMSNDVIRAEGLGKTYAEGSLHTQVFDGLDIAVSDYAHPRPELLRCTDEVEEEVLYSHLLKSNCPVTGQPDWGTLVVDYHGLRLEAASLLAYVASPAFEPAVELATSDIEKLLCAAPVSQKGE